MSEANHYDAFISYRRSDASTVARWIRRELQAFRPPRALRGKVPDRLRVYLDTAYEVGTTDFFENTIRPALLASRYLIVVATPDAVRREGGVPDWVTREIDEFSAGPNGGNILVVRGAGPFDGALPGDIGARFPNIEIIDLRGVGRFWRLNPIKAAKFADEKLKLIAPIVGVTTADVPILRREEERIQQMRLGLATGATLAIVVAMCVLTVYAFQSRMRARQALESSLATSTAFIDILGAPAAQAKPSSNDTLLLNEACDLFDQLRKESGAVVQAQPLVACLHERANNYAAQGEVATAEKLLESAVAQATAIQRASKHPADARSVLRAYEFLIDFYRRQHHDDKALAALYRAEHAAEAIADTYPDLDRQRLDESRVRFLKSAADIEGSEGHWQAQLRDLDRASQCLEKFVALFKDSARSDILIEQAELLLRGAVVAVKARDFDAATKRNGAAAGKLNAAMPLPPGERRAIAARLDLATTSVIAAVIATERGDTAAAKHARANGLKQLADIPQPIKQADLLARYDRLSRALGKPQT